MEAPYNAPPPSALPTMDGFALDFRWNFRWEKERLPTDAEMQAIGGVFTPADRTYRCGPNARHRTRR